MKDKLELPLLLKGPWDSVLIMTYTVDLPFFEKALLSQFYSQCRNKIILADGEKLLEVFEENSQSGLARYLNRNYLVEGIFKRNVAHAKMILLVNSEQGRLLVGSGNLGPQGYASDGELFTHYEYSPQNQKNLPAFLAARNLLEGIISRGFLSYYGQKQVTYLLENAPWLYSAPSYSPELPFLVCHNLKYSFHAQLQELINKQIVEELWVLSPFYDKDASALRQLLVTFKPQNLTLFIQPGYTSADPVALQNVLDNFPGVYHVQPIGSGRQSPYLHAKLFLFKLTDQAICLQGSPNLSQVAMLRNETSGNLEMANLLVGERDEFDYLLDAHDLKSEVTNLGELNLFLHSQEITGDILPQLSTFRLIGGDLNHDLLTLRYQGTTPNLDQAFLVISGETFPFNPKVTASPSEFLEIKLSTQAITLIDQSASLSLSWTSYEIIITSNPIFICNRAALDKTLQSAGEEKTLGLLAEPDLYDDELEQYLAALESTLILDPQGVWQKVPGTASSFSISTSDSTEEIGSVPVDYSQVDLEKIRQHPKVQQYLRGAVGIGSPKSNLQIILDSIIRHFQDLIIPEPANIAHNLSSVGEDLLPQRDDGTADTMEERENEEEELQKGQINIQKRVERQVKKFISRYLKGINNSQFQTLVGYEVLSKNYIIFDHILWRLFSKEWMGEDYIIDSFLNIWRLFWGTSNQDEAGYFLKLSDDQQDQVLLWHYEHHCDAQLLAALFYSAFISREEGWEARYFALRDFLHKILNHPYFTITDEELIIAHQILSNLIPFPAPTYLEIIDELIALSNYNNQSSFLRSFEKKYNLPPQSCNFKTAEVKDRSNPNNDKNKQVDVIIINAPALLTDIEAISAVTDWQRFETKSYYRIYSIPSKRGIYYEVNIQESCYWSADSKDMFDIDLGPIIPPVLTYEVALARLRKIANKLDMFLESNTAKPAS